MTKELRILHCLRAPVGGLFRHVRDLVYEQSRLGYQIGILCDLNTGGETAEVVLEDLRPSCSLGIARVPMSRQIGFRDFTAYLAMSKFAKSVNANILHGHGAKGGAYVRLAGSKLKKQLQNVKIFYTPHGGSLHYGPDSLQGRLFLGLERHLSSKTDGIIFESAYSSRVFEEKIGFPGCETRIIHNGLNQSEFHHPDIDVNAADFLFIGELRHLKGVDLLLKALARLREKQSVQAIIVGSGPDEADFKQLTDELDLSDYVQFAGALPAWDAFSKGRCLVVPSRAESFPYIVLEAAAARLPLIMTNVGGIPEIVHETDTKLIDVDDIELLTGEMNKFLTDPSPFIEQSKQLQERVANNFTVEKMTDSILDFYFSKISF